ncbi:M23 family metallopeptidase [Palleronia sp. KMU-117]|uniref:M23 family metallopeptidase n=1 Tax=Palleronia sp. KMU-117 TaxID=3434108 RepID=UPI003D73834F
MKLLLLSADPSLTSWRTLPGKLSTMKRMLNAGKGATWDVEVRYVEGVTPKVKDARIVHAWLNDLIRPYYREGWDIVGFHFSRAQKDEWGIEGIRGSNPRTPDQMGDFYFWADEHSKREGLSQFIQTGLHELCHEYYQETGLPDETHAWHDANPNIEGLLARIDWSFYQPLRRRLKLEKTLWEQVLELTKQLVVLRSLTRPLPYHWNLVTQTWLNPDETTYPATGVHVGTDFAAPEGTPILAPADGTITRTGKSSSLGYWCEFRFGSRYLVALHLRSEPRPVWVRKGTPIGYVGRSGMIKGVHAHLELWRGPMDRTKLTSAEAVRSLTDDITKVIL